MNVRRAKLVHAEQAFEMTLANVSASADDLNLGLLVERVNDEIVYAAGTLFKHSIAFEVPRFMVGASVYDQQEMRRELAAYLRAVGGYDVEIDQNTDNKIFVQWDKKCSAKVRAMKAAEEKELETLHKQRAKTLARSGGVKQNPQAGHPARSTSTNARQKNPSKPNPNHTGNRFLDNHLDPVQTGP